MLARPCTSTLFPTRRSSDLRGLDGPSSERALDRLALLRARLGLDLEVHPCRLKPSRDDSDRAGDRSEEHTSELQSQSNLVCRLLLEKKKHLATAIGNESIDD